MPTDNIRFSKTPKPFFTTFFNDCFGHLEQRQENDRCADFELRLADCLEAYGYPASEEKCLPYLRDLQECVISPKQMRRTELMRNERDRQYKAGERKKHFEEEPRIDSY